MQHGFCGDVRAISSSGAPQIVGATAQRHYLLKKPKQIQNYSVFTSE